jgi:small subunit ribosomal protein S8
MDSIVDLLTRIKNAQSAGHESVLLPFSKTKLALAKILEREGFLAKVEHKGVKAKEKLELKLKYDQGAPAIQGARRISRPSQRIYRKAVDIKPFRHGYGVAIISTSAGMMTDKEARKNKLGGEVICEIW